ncbi:hypothetical protein OG613_49185 (plasmid) [Streptomyces sp. NBC_00015]|uniref:DUF6035 family protein n=1 Tax=Streptomyces sp. NBC_00015 TaxID=2903611 RepID=UPI002F913C6B
MNSPTPQPEGPRAFTQERAQVLALDGKSGQLRYLPDKQGNDEMEPGVTWRAHVADGMLLCPMPGCGPFSRVVAAGDRRHHFAHPTGAGNHHENAPETLWHLSAKEVLRRWAQSHPRLREWTLHIDDTPITRQDRWRRPDVLAIAPDDTTQVAFEVQYSALTGTDWKTRHDFYAAAGVVDIWLFAHHGTHQWTQADPGQRRDLAWSENDWVATIKLNGLHQKMLKHGVIPLWLDPTTQRVGTATARFDPGVGWPGEHLGKTTGYSLPPLDTFPACYVAADALEQCDVDLDARELLTPARRAQRKERERFLADGQAAQARRRAAQEEVTRLRREAEREKRRASAAQFEAEQEERDRLAEEDRLREEEARAAAEAKEMMPLSEEYPRVFEQDPPPPARAPWWPPWRRRT